MLDKAVGENINLLDIEREQPQGQTTHCSLKQTASLAESVTPTETDMGKAHRNSAIKENPGDKLLDGMDPDLRAFLRTNIDSFAKWDLIHFFHANPYTVDKAKNIAHYIGRGTDRIRQALAELAAHGIVTQRRLGNMTVYSLPEDPEIRDLIHRFVETCHDQQFRFKAVYQVVRAMR